MAAMSVNGPLVSCSEEAEALACRKALEFVVELSFTKMIIEGDNVAIMKAARLHGQAIFGVVSVSDTGTGTTRWILVSGECPLFYFIFFSFLRPALTRLRRV